MVALARGEQCSFLGFEFRRVRRRRGAWRAWYPPLLKKRTALLRKLKEIFRRYQSQPIERGVALMNPILRGWVRYFAVGDASRCCGLVKDWVEKKVRRHLRRARKRRGFGWKRWRRQWLYQRLGLCKLPGAAPTTDAESAPSLIGPITLDVKRAGKRSAGNPHAAFDAAGAGNVATVALRTHSAIERAELETLHLQQARLPLDPTCEGLEVKSLRSTHPPLVLYERSLGLSLATREDLIDGRPGRVEDRVPG